MGNPHQVAVVVDSAASLPTELSCDPLLNVVPMKITVGDKTYRDGVDLTPLEYYRRLKDNADATVTASPSPQDFTEAFRKVARGASSILCVTVSPRFSSSYDFAQIAKRTVEGEGIDVHIEVLDTETAAGGEGLVTTAALRAAHAGATIAEVLEVARSVVEEVTLLAFLDTLYYVWRGGRVRMVAHAATSLLRIKPLFELSRGEVRQLARPRTKRRAIESMLDIARLRVGDRLVHGAVMHADAPEHAEVLRRRVESEFDCSEIFVTEFSPVMGSHTGPGLLGFAFWTKNRLV